MLQRAPLRFSVVAEAHPPRLTPVLATTPTAGFVPGPVRSGAGASAVGLASGASVPHHGCAAAGARDDTGLPEAGAVHERLKALRGLGNEVRLRFLEALRTLHDGHLFFELGYSSFLQYCDRELGLARSTALEYIRVAAALCGLPKLKALFGVGDLSWEQVRAISRVATAETEAAWIGLAFDETVQILQAEVREACRTGRNAPRDRRHGLPNLLVRISLEMTLEERERVRAAFMLVNVGSGPDLGGPSGDWAGHDEDGPRDARSPLVRWADGVLSGVIPAHATVSGDDGHDPANRSPEVRSTPVQTIVYRMCPACREASLHTAEGPVAVSPERIAQLEPRSNTITIAPDEELECQALAPGQVDEPNSPRLARHVLHREGLRCANPGCGRRARLHAHHIVLRSKGGPTRMSNEVAVCDTCHALLHKGLLEVTGVCATWNSCESGWRR